VTSGDFKPFLNIRQDAFFGEVSYEGLSFADLKVIGSYTNYYERRFVDGDFTPFPSLVEGVLTTSKSASEEIQFISKDNGSPFKWVVGGYFFQEDLGGSFQQQQLYVVDANNTPDLTQPLNAWANPTNRIDIYTRSYAGYAQGTYSVTDKLRVLAGVRYTQDNRHWDIYGQTRTQQALTYSNPVLLGTKKNWNRTTWKGGLEYDLGPTAMSYFTVSTGYLAGNAQGQYSGAATYDAQTATAYELGLKTTFADGKIRFNVAAYYNQYRNLLSIKFVDTATTTLAQTTNAGAVNSKGVEVEADWIPNDNLRLGARVSFMHARFGDFVFNRRYQEGGNIRPNASGQFTAWQLNGLQVANSPDFTATVFASYRVDLGDSGSLTPMVSTYINSGYRTSDDPLLFGVQPSFQKTDLSLTWASADDKTTVRGWIRNIENKATLTRGTRFGGDLAVVDYAAPRTYGVTISYNF
jgi:iron complex outermembrane receptor protein